MILGEVVVHEPSQRIVQERLLGQRRAQRHNDAPEDLAARGLGVDDSAGRHRVDDPGHAHLTELLVHLHFAEDRGVRVGAVLGLDLLIRRGLALGDDPVVAGRLDDLGQGMTRRGIRLQKDTPALQRDEVELGALQR